VARADLADVFSVRGDASLLVGSTLAGRVSLHIKILVAPALPAYALPVVGARAKQPFVSVAREVVAFAEVAGHPLALHPRGVTLAFATHALAFVAAERLAAVVRPAPVLENTTVQVEVVSVALAVLAERIGRAGANTAAVVTGAVAKERILFVIIAAVLR